MIPALLAQTDQTFTMVLYHADVRSHLRTRAKHLFISRQCDLKGWWTYPSDHSPIST